jgi:Fe-S-cluster-containing dehydrogenase component
VSIGVKRTPATQPTAGAFGDSIFVIDQSRCIGCRACVQACEECGTHRGQTMIHLDEIDRAASTQTAPMVCMHCEDPTCAEVCPADAIKQNEDGVVQSSLKPRCIGCSNCVLACPFGVPKMNTEYELMMKCDMCYDRTSVGKRPMCATVCPSQALFFGTHAEIEAIRPRSRPINEFHFGQQTIHTKVRMMVPREAPVNHLDVADAMFSHEEPTDSEDQMLSSALYELPIVASR